MHTRVALFLVPVVAAVSGDHGFGPLPPRPLPDVVVTTQDGTQVPLPTLVRGKAVAVQFMFSSCSTACPLLGSLFHSAEKRLAANRSDRLLLSISVDAAGDTPARLKQWLASHGGGPRWQAVTLAPKDLETLLGAFGQKAGQPAYHSTQVFFVSRAGEIVARTTSLPEAKGLAAELERTP